MQVNLWIILSLPRAIASPLVMHHLKKATDADSQTDRDACYHLLTHLHSPGWLTALHSCYEITSPCGPPTQRVRERTGETQGNRRRFIISLVKRRTTTTTNKVTMMLVALVLKWFKDVFLPPVCCRVDLCVICNLFILSNIKLLIGNIHVSI